MSAEAQKRIEEIRGRHQARLSGTYDASHALLLNDDVTWLLEQLDKTTALLVGLQNMRLKFADYRCRSCKGVGKREHIQTVIHEPMRTASFDIQGEPVSLSVGFSGFSGRMVFGDCPDCKGSGRVAE